MNLLADIPLIEEWHPTLNGEIDRYKITQGSNVPVWWLGKDCGHEWETQVNNRVNKKTRCPYCTGAKVLAGFNDLATTHPELIQEWSPQNTLQPHEVSVGSNKGIIWVCDKQHEWEIAVSARIKKNKISSCPVCIGKVVQTGFNDLASQYPQIAKEYSLSNPIPADQMFKGSNSPVEWICPQGHTWEQSVASRVKHQTTCPVERNRKLLTGYNDALTHYKGVERYWSPANAQSPQELLFNDRQAYKWVCPKGHQWEAKLSRQMKQNVCESCEKIAEVSAKHPHLQREYSPNNTLPFEEAILSPDSVWWVGECEHEWEATVKNRQAGTGCPYEQGHRVLVGFNDLATLHPAIAQEWHPTKNEGLTPTQVTASASTKVWWQCDSAHEWDSTVKNRTRGKTTCPFCAGNKVLLGYNDLATTHPELVPEWHPVKNALTPYEVSAGSGIPIQWLCEKNHEWTVSPNQRTSHKTSCPTCVNAQYISQAEQDIYNYVRSILPDEIIVKQSDRKILAGQELDIYIPQLSIAIEFNGLFYHSESYGKGKFYHHDKWRNCQTKGIQLIQIWEDEWKRNPTQIKKMLAHKLQANRSAESIYARKTFATSLTKQETEAFLEEHHIQGHANGSYYLGLKDKANEELVAVLVLKKETHAESKTLNIVRYATSQIVVGGFTKLLAYATQKYAPKSFVTFSDNCVSDGNLYSMNGFMAEKELAPDYRYIVRGVRQHKFNYRLKRFKNDPTLKYEEGLTERELALLNNLHRIWDAGKIRWVKVV